MPSDGPIGGARCVVHPGRVASDACPVCARPRCAVDATRWGDSGCAACAATRGMRRGPAPDRELLVRAGLAGVAVALLGGFVVTQYVGTRYFSVVAPGLVGLAASWAVSAAATRLAAHRRVVVLVIAAIAGLVGTGLGFRLVPGGQSLVSPIGDVAPPYLASVVGALAWPLLFGPQTRRPGRGQPAGRGTDS